MKPTPWEIKIMRKAEISLWAEEHGVTIVTAEYLIELEERIKRLEEEGNHLATAN